MRAKKQTKMASLPKKLAFGYVRVSTGQQAAEGVSLEAQRDQIKAWCDFNGYELAEIFQDAITGTKSHKRPGFQSAIAAVMKAGAPLIVYSLSRFARSTIDAISITQQMERAGADLVSLKEKFDTTSASGKLYFRIMAVLAEFESDVIKERTTMALDHLRRKGMRISGKIPFGFNLEGKSLVPNPTEQLARDRIIKMRAENISLRAIAEELNKLKIRSKGGKPWGASSIQSILAAHAREAK
jgi:DNA invertase Pin-like site-specific DNA recombinase